MGWEVILYGLRSHNMGKEVNNMGWEVNIMGWEVNDIGWKSIIWVGNLIT